MTRAAGLAALPPLAMPAECNNRAAAARAAWKARLARSEAEPPRVKGTQARLAGPLARPRAAPIAPAPCRPPRGEALTGGFIAFLGPRRTC